MRKIGVENVRIFCTKIRAKIAQKATLKMRAFDVVFRPFFDTEMRR
jgi:hypothetical protein